MENSASDNDSFPPRRDGNEQSHIRDAINEPSFDERGITSILDGKPAPPAISSLSQLLYKPIHEGTQDVDSLRGRPDGSLVLGLTRSAWEAYMHKLSRRDTINIPYLDERGITSILNDEPAPPAISSLSQLLYKPIYEGEQGADGFRRRPDGSLVLGLTRSEWEAYVKKYSPFLSREEINYIRDTINIPYFDPFLFEGFADPIRREKENENRHGKRVLLASSVFMLLSAHLEPRKSLSVYGEITSDENNDDIYKTKFRSHSDDGNLILNGPSEECNPRDVCHILENRKLSMRLYDQQGEYPILGDCHPIILNYSPNEFEHVDREVVQNSEISLTFRYVSIPMGVCGRLKLKIFNKDFLEEKDTSLPQQIKVCGTVVATYKNTFGSYNSEDIVLFDKDPKLNQYETLNLDEGTNLLSFGRCWVAAPVYSVLHLRIHLFDFEKKEPLVKQDVELATENNYRSSKKLLTEGFLITVSASWFPPTPPPREFEDVGDDQIFRSSPPPAIEVFSVLICHKVERPELQIHGHLQFTAGFKLDFEESGIDIFKKEKEVPLSLVERSYTIFPMFNGSSLSENVSSFSMICDLKDTLDILSIKGRRYCSENPRRERQICSIFRGDHGFAALHYSIFSSAVQVNLMVTCKRKASEGFNSLTVSGSLCAQYADCDYSSQYKRDCYRIVLFKGKAGLVLKDNCSLIPLSRSSFVVPLFSFPIFEVDLMIDTQKLSENINVPIGTERESIEMKEYEVEFVLKWETE